MLVMDKGYNAEWVYETVKRDIGARVAIPVRRQ